MLVQFNTRNRGWIAALISLVTGLDLRTCVCRAGLLHDADADGVPQEWAKYVKAHGTLDTEGNLLLHDEGMLDFKRTSDVGNTRAKLNLRIDFANTNGARRMFDTRWLRIKQLNPAVTEADINSKTRTEKDYNFEVTMSIGMNGLLELSDLAAMNQISGEPVTITQDEIASVCDWSQIGATHTDNFNFAQLINTRQKSLGITPPAIPQVQNNDEAPSHPRQARELQSVV